MSDTAETAAPAAEQSAAVAQPAASEPTPVAQQSGSTADASGGMGDPAPAETNSQLATEDVPPQQTSEWLGTPEKGYTADGFDLPEGFEVDDTTAEGLAGVCKDLGLSQKAFATIVNRMTPVLELAQREQIATIRQNNLKAFAADKELGGAKAKQTIAQAKLAYDKYCPAECREVLNRLGLDAHPGMIRMFYQLSQMLSDDIAPRSSAGGRSGYDLSKFFNNTKMN